jgi:hypothetical protein
MTWMVLGILLVLLVAAVPARRALARRREARLAALEEFRVNRKIADEDVTVFGEQVAELHVDTLATELDGPMREDYQRALESYEEAKRRLAGATTVGEVAGVTAALDDGRYARACVLARRDGTDLPQRREPCFFNPQHGPAVTDLAWAPQGGVERQIAVCGADARRLEAGDLPDVRLVRVGDRYVKWYEADQQRGLLVATFGSEAVAGVPKYVMLEADLNQMRGQMPGGGGRL